MIGIMFSGRLGNQMFQYAFGMSVIHTINKETFFIFHKKGLNKTTIRKYFKLNNFNLLKNTLLKLRYSFFLKKEIIEIPNRFEINSIKNINNKIVVGYFQSEEYFNSIISEVKSNFLIKKKHTTAFEKKYRVFFNSNKIITIHIRRGDYKTYNDQKLGGSDLTLPIKYYYKILNTIENIEDYKILVISDETEEIKPLFNNYENIYFEKNSLIIDFQIIQNADICIISNSTFAWWAAYLNNKPNKIVFAPKYWLGFKVKKEYPAGIMLTNWKWIEV